MKLLLQRSMITVVALAGILAATASPAAAIVGGQDATQTYPGTTFVSALYPGIGTGHTLPCICPPTTRVLDPVTRAGITG